MFKLLKEVLITLFKKPATIRYPKEKVSPPIGYRGVHKYNPKLCIRCGLCVKTCPTNACKLDKDIKIDLSTCIFCGECEDICPKKAIVLTRKFTSPQRRP